MDEFYADRAFDPDATAHYPGPPVWPVLARLLGESGVSVATIDVAERNGIPPSGMLLGTLCRSERAERLLDRGATGALLFCWESPVIAWSFYRELRRIARRYSTVLLFPGMADRLHGHPGVRPAFVPQPYRRRIADRPWSERGLLALVNSNKRLAAVSPVGFARAAFGRVFSRAPVRLRPSVRRQAAGLRDPTLGRELYSERLRAMEHFVHASDVGLFGRGWGDDDTPAAVRARWGGAVTDKLATLAGYRFALCFENTEFPGYITEKMFDGIYAGCVPVYRGAPDIETYVPPEIFVDARAYPTYAELERALRAMSPDEAARRREAAREFLASPAFDRFHVDNVAKVMRDAIITARR